MEEYVGEIDGGRRHSHDDCKESCVGHDLRLSFPASEDEFRVPFSRLQGHQQYVIKHDVLIGDHGGQFDRFVFRRSRGGVGWICNVEGGDL